MNLNKILALNCIAILLAANAQALTPQETEVQTKLSSDSTLLSGWLSDNLKYAVPFNSTSGNVVPNQVKLFGFEVGIEGVFSSTKVDSDALRVLPTTLVNPKTINTSSRLPMPLILGHAKIGLPFGLDGGIRIGGIPETTHNSGTERSKVKNKVFGIDLRKKLIEEGVVKPFGLTLGLNYTHAKGSVDITNSFDSQTYTTSDAHTAKIRNGQTALHGDWKTDSVGLQAVLDKQIFFITPYIGASINRNSGDINNSITTTGTAEIDGTAGNALNATGLSSSKANKWDTRALLGVEFNILPFVKFGIHGEYAGNRNVAGALGLRFQFH